MRSYLKLLDLIFLKVHGKLTKMRLVSNLIYNNVKKNCWYVLIYNGIIKLKFVNKIYYFRLVRYFNKQFQYGLLCAVPAGA